MKTVNKVSKITGASMRTLHHYDAIGLLKPTTVSEAGHRLYDGEPDKFCVKKNKVLPISRDSGQKTKRKYFNLWEKDFP